MRQKNGVVPGWDATPLKNTTRSRGLPHEWTKNTRYEIHPQDERTTFVTNDAVDITQAVITGPQIQHP
jgi:hypothetical protein